ncbi:MAG: hypothetical protein C0490_10625 [Marivirga sp.]|nr:hypothetical protein [Marivirga sp.]
MNTYNSLLRCDLGWLILLSAQTFSKFADKSAIGNAVLLIISTLAGILTMTGGNRNAQVQREA